MPEDNIPTPDQFLATKKPSQQTSEIPTPDEFLGASKPFDPKEHVIAKKEDVKVIGVRSNEPSGFSLPEGATLLSVKEAPRRNMSAFAEPQDPQNVDAIIDELARTSRNGSLMDSEKDVLKQLITNPNTTPEQAKKGIATIQGYDTKQTDDSQFYYLKNDENGVLMPYALAPGERPPSQAQIPSIWGSQKDANDDAWYTDALKSLFNAVPGVVGSVADLGQLAYKGITGETSESLNDVKLATEVFKMAKDEDLNAQIYNVEGVKKWSDLVASERFDFGPEAIWGTLNSALESVPQFFLGAGAAAKIAKGVSGAAQIGKKAQAASAFTGSFLTMLGDNMDAAEEAGLQGRDVAKFAMATTAAQASIDAAIGVPSSIFRNSFRKSEKELIKGIAKTIEKDASGLITEQGFKQLATEVPIAYGKMASIGAKAILKDAGKEMLQETSQDVIEKSSKNLWDKMSDDDKAKFGVDALSPESFASYIQNGIAGFVSGAPMAVASTNYKKKYQEQSKDLFNRIKAGPEAVNELKANLAVAKDKGVITEEEYNQASFKIDAYNNYNEQTKDLDLDDNQKKEAFELSFNIDALKSEIPTNKEEIDKLDPIAQAKINSKKEIMKGLQKKLDEIILGDQTKKETKVAPETAEKTIPKEEGQEGQSLDDLMKKYAKAEKGAKEADFEQELESAKKERVLPKDTDPAVWAKMTSRERKRSTQEFLKNEPKNEMDVTLEEWENGKIAAVIDDQGRRLDFAQSAPSNTGQTPDYINRKALPEFEEQKTPEGTAFKRAKEKVKVKRVDIDAFDYETDKPDLDKDGNQKRKGILVAYNPKTGEYIGNIREMDRIPGRAYRPSEYSPSEKKQLDALKSINYNSDEALNPYLYRPKSDVSKSQAAKTEKANAPELGKTGQAPDIRPAPEKRVQRELVNLTEEERVAMESEMKSARKPSIDQGYITDREALASSASVTYKTADGRSIKEVVPVVEIQADIRRQMGYLKEILNCLHA